MNNMQLHDVKSNTPRKEKKRIGRGGKRGTYCGRGMKGQKSRAGASRRADFRGGDNPLWKLFPKQRGAKKKVDVKHRMFRLRRAKPYVLNLDVLNKKFGDGDKVSPETLLKKELIKSLDEDIKILGDGKLEKKLNFEGLKFSIAALKKIKDSGGTISHAR